MIADSVDLDLAVFRKYAGLSLPRHVSYPMPSWWHPLEAEAAARMYAESDGRRPAHDLSLYIHVPFCETLCKFCACNRVIQRKDAGGAEERTAAYVRALEVEIRHLGAVLHSPRRLRQIHWGGGTPTYLAAGEIERLHRTTEESFDVVEDAEISMEIDPRVTDREMLAHLRDLGFNRLSMGVQDFDEQVQRHVRRIQSQELVRETVSACRELGFDSVNFDLIYGMPYQTVDTIRETVEGTIALAPDRIAYYHYAQIPEKIATQRGMDYRRLPDSETKLGMFLVGLQLFQQAGYEFVGLDHFAKPEEGLTRARDDGSLQRNFQGMTTGGGLDQLGAGSSAIGHLLGVGFLQNVKDLDDYLSRGNAGRTVIERGKRFTADDLIRQAVIGQLYCYAEIRPWSIEEEFGIGFGNYFAREMRILEELETDGLVRIAPDGRVQATCPLGRVLLRNVAAVFDAYLSPDAWAKGEESCFSANA